MQFFMEERRRLEHPFRFWLHTLADIGITAPKEHSRMLWHDLRYTFRTLRKAPAFAAIVVLSLALGIGANTAVFSIIDAALLKAMPVRAPNQLVDVTRLTVRGASHGFSYPMYREFRDRSDAFEGVIAMYNTGISMSIGSDTERVRGEVVSGNYFTVLGVNPAAGRLLTPADDSANSPPVAVLSYPFWQRRFGGDSAIIGKTVYLSGKAFTIAGIVGRDFHGTLLGVTPDVRVPMAHQADVMPGEDLLNDPRTSWLSVMARLQPAVPLSRAEQELNVLHANELERTMPPDLPAADRSRMLSEKIRLDPGAAGSSEIRQNARQPLIVMLCVVAVVLLLSCANLANLVLARGLARRREIAVRLSLGAGRARIVRQLLSESTILAALGGGLGLILAFAGSHALLNLAPDTEPRLELTVSPDFRIFAFAALVSIATGILFGLVPAFETVRIDLLTAIKCGDTASGRRRRFDLRKSLVVVQVALTVLLVAVSALFTRTLQHVRDVNLGFDPNNIVVIGLEPKLNGYSDSRVRAFWPALVSKVAMVPGAKSVALSHTRVMTANGRRATVIVGGYPAQNGEDMNVNFDTVTPGYLATLGIPLLAGRDFNAHDTENSARVAVINETMARYFFGSQNPIGRHFAFAYKHDEPMEIIGVARDARYRTLRETTWRTAYVPLTQRPEGDMTLNLRVDGDPNQVINGVRAKVKELDARLPPERIRLLTGEIYTLMAPERLMASVSSVFGILAIAIAAIGIYGVVASSVARRVREIGIRMALGAHRDALIRMILRQSVGMIAVGLAIGIPLMLGAAQAVKSQLYGITPNDPVAVLGSIAALLFVALLASWLPARRAASVDPAVTLREE